MADLSNNPLVSPPFAGSPPVKLNVNASILGLVLAILAGVGFLLSLFAGGLVAIISFAGGLSPIWLLGALVALVAEALGTAGGLLMFRGNRQGKELVIYGLSLAALGAVVTLVGEVIAYSGSIYAFSAAGAVVGFLIDLIVYGIIYYLVVISRFPGQAPLAPRMGYPPPPPPPPAAG